jgi:hypothetical protein
MSPAGGSTSAKDAGRAERQHGVTETGSEAGGGPRPARRSRTAARVLGCRGRPLSVIVVRARHGRRDRLTSAWRVAGRPDAAPDGPRRSALLARDRRVERAPTARARGLLRRGRAGRRGRRAAGALPQSARRAGLLGISAARRWAPCCRSTAASRAAPCGAADRRVPGRLRELDPRVRDRGARRGAGACSPRTLLLWGVAYGALAVSLTTFISRSRWQLRRGTTDRYWLLGGLEGAPGTTCGSGGPAIVAGTALVVAQARDAGRAAARRAGGAVGGRRRAARAPALSC